MCSFPTAEFPLAFDGEAVLTIGQEYAIGAHLHFPDSDNNRLSGMSILTLELVDNAQNTIKMFRKPFSIPYRSKMVRLAKLLLLLPLYILNLIDEEIYVFLPLASGFQHTQDSPVSMGRVTIESLRLEWSFATIAFNARLTGIQGFLYYWPWVSSAFLAVSMFSLLNILYLLLGYYRYAQPTNASPHSIVPSSNIHAVPPKTPSDSEVVQSL
ncbi:hypothetical protein T265_06840 [Opisthorchis viverrini]|uniref:Seipin n=1 Tax=Opisthorchis viverrini TaxID=6198 RepID=A0A074ZIZ8_OPIVI|nr:hypothetical protein T265_06840 [Opisthorchis viverrini]KER25737.1 hypothetical protein T265_06840 [Opisthorchis viverrini]